ncbi:MAG: MmgE/PrpD family protein [Epulopiscium sp.]|nr:MmgE/PrpD family protein [Candidatus Epulonipiscium sp.]
MVKRVTEFLNTVKDKFRKDDEAFRRARLALLDYLGVTSVGYKENFLMEWARNKEVLSNKTISTIIGIKLTNDASNAALINGISAHVLDFDDSLLEIPSHSTAVLMSAGMAISEEANSSIQDFLEAYILGIEFQSRIAKLLKDEFKTKAWHPTSVLGSLGSTIVCATILKFDEDELNMGLGIASSLASGLKANFGTMAKPFQVGWAAKTGIVSCNAVRAGITANKNTIFDKYGFLTAFGGIVQAEGDIVGGDSLAIINPGLYIKPYPCCASTHSSIDASLDLVKTSTMDVSEIKQVTCFLDERRSGYIDRPQPKNELEAKFSIQYCIAAALTDGRVGLDTFTFNRFKDEKLHRLMEKICVKSSRSEEISREFMSTVIVEMKDGMVKKADLSSPRGLGNHQPESIINKFYSCITKYFPLSVADQVKKIVMEEEYKYHPVNLIGNLFRSLM